MEGIPVVPWGMTKLWKPKISSDDDGGGVGGDGFGNKV